MAVFEKKAAKKAARKFLFENAPFEKKCPRRGWAELLEKALRFKACIFEKGNRLNLFVERWIIQSEKFIEQKSNSSALWLKKTLVLRIRWIDPFLRLTLVMTTETQNWSREEIFERELEPHFDAVFNFAYHLTYDKDRSRDLMQETFLKAFKAIESYEIGSNAKAWLMTICRNLFINEYRKKKVRGRSVDYEEFVVYQGSVGNSLGPNPFKYDPHDQMVGDEVTRALNALSPEGKMVVLLADVEEFSYEEIASITEVPIGTVRSRLHRARKSMEKKLKNYAESMGYGPTEGAEKE